MLKLEKLKTEWQSVEKKQSKFTEKVKKWVHAWGRKGFTIDKITKDTFNCLLHFIGGNASTQEDSDPIMPHC